jgi:beta-N-acetylhexosaminidase
MSTPHERTTQRHAAVPPPTITPPSMRAVQPRHSEELTRAVERAYVSGKWPISPKQKQRDSRHVMRWIITLVLGVASVLFLINRGVILGARPNLEAQATYSAQARAALVNAQALQILNSMTLDEKVGQLIVPMAQDYSLNGDLQAMITNDHIGGFYVSDDGYMSQAQVRDFTKQIQSAAHIPLILGTDFEGDQGFDVLGASLPQQPSEPEVGATGNPHQAYLKGVNDGKALASVGINVDFGPVVDVLTNPDNPILQGRTYGSTASAVTTMASAEVDGLTSQGVAPTLKHFPGLGSSTTDPHHALPVINLSLAQMQQVDLVPYKTLIAQGKVSMIMTTHMLIPALDPKLPTSVSPKVLNGLLRTTLGYDGVVISDALFMQGVLDAVPSFVQPADQPSYAGLMAFEAGTDMLLGAYSEYQTRKTIDYIESALKQGDFTQSYLDASVMRVLKFKIQWHIIPQNFTGHASVQTMNPGMARIQLPTPHTASVVMDMPRRGW